MLGPRQERQPRLFYTGFNLETRVRPGHPLRAVAATVDFGFVRAAVADRYGTRGNPSVDPIVLLKLMFLLFFEQVPSERALRAQLGERLDWLWFCGYDLHDELPDHSVLSKARRRGGPEVFAGFFQRVLGPCVAAGLVDGKVVHVDGSVIEADADQDRLQVALRVAGTRLYERLDQATGPANPDGAAAPAAPAPVAVPALPPLGLADPARRPVPPAALGPVGQATPGHEPAPGTLISPADPDARLTRKNGRPYLGYKDHRVVDDRCGIITATLTTDAAVAESAVLSQVLAAPQFQTGPVVDQAVADKGYGTTANYQDLHDRGVRPCIPHPAVREDPDKFPRASFLYDAAGDTYRCPAGQDLTVRGAASDGRFRYQAAAGVCAACALKDRCPNGQRGRLLSRNVGQEVVDWADTCLSPAQRRDLRRRRKVRAEGSFADATNQHGYKRARWRGLGRVNIQNLLIAATQNLRKLLRHRPRRPAEPARARPVTARVLPGAPGPDRGRPGSWDRPACAYASWTVAGPRLN